MSSTGNPIKNVTFIDATEPTYPAAQVAALLKKAAEQAKVIICHAHEHAMPIDETCADIDAAFSDLLPADAIAALAKVEREAEARAVGALLDMLLNCQDFLEGMIDTVDGEDGLPKPNKAMQLSMEITSVINAAKKKDGVGK